MEDQLRNILLCFFVMWVVANISPQMMMRIAVPALHGLGAAAGGVALFGTIKLGARRWLHIGVVDIQPSEFMKIATPLMLAWFFQSRAGLLRWKSYADCGVLLACRYLIVRQPDLGTALLVVAAGFTVIFLAGLSWKALVGLFLVGGGGLPVAWSVLHDYQRDRVMTLIDPTTDPLGKGFHIIQSTIAVGSGGVTGKGWTHGTQAHLNSSLNAPPTSSSPCIPRSSAWSATDPDGAVPAADRPGPDDRRECPNFSRLLAGAMTMIYFTYAFVNMGMVSGILPVVGVPCRS
jgi:rod shape determining protein RodA